MATLRQKFSALSNVPERDQWDFDRAQAEIDAADQIMNSLPEPRSGDQQTQYETALRRKQQAEARQQYLLKSNIASEEVNEALDQADADWVAENPPPAPPPEEESEEQ